MVGTSMKQVTQFSPVRWWQVAIDRGNIFAVIEGIEYGAL